MKGNVYTRFLQAFKITFVSFFTIVLANAVQAQNNNESNPNPTPGIQAGTIDDLPLKPFRMPSLQEVGGSPFLTSDYQNGTVELGQGRVVSGVSVKFNTFNNAILVLKNGQDLKLDFFELVSYELPDGKGETRHFIFKAGYPSIDNHSDNSIYQVLSTGSKVHLLKYITQKIEESSIMGDFGRREIVTTEQLYLYFPGGEMKRRKPGKQSIIDALPGMAEKIEEIATKNKLKLKSESEITTLIDELNKP